MMKNNKTCIVCGEVYTYCPNCAEFYSYPTWMNIFHDETCKDIFETVSSYKFNEITKDEAKVKLAKLTYSDRELPQDIKDTINEINHITVNEVDQVEVAITKAVEVIEEVEKKNEQKVFKKK